MKGRFVYLSISIVAILVTIKIATALMTLPAIPRTKTKMNATTEAPLEDATQCGCNSSESYNSEPRSVRVAVDTAYTCQGYNLESKIRWDWADNYHGLTVVTTNKQTDGDERTLRNSVHTWTVIVLRIHGLTQQLQ